MRSHAERGNEVYFLIFQEIPFFRLRFEAANAIIKRGQFMSFVGFRHKEHFHGECQ